MGTQTAALGRYQRAVEERLRDLERERVPARLWERDASLWTAEPARQKAIKNRLGWLTVTEAMAAEREALRALREEVRGAGFRRALLLGMGGSSLAPEVCRFTFGVPPGGLDLAVLDSTVPAAVRALADGAEETRTLYLVSSKSGTTAETLAFFRFFEDRARAEHFVAITDPGTPLERMGRERRFRRVFPNPPDIGGRYSALSLFGLVPAALLGVDVGALLERAERLRQACASSVPIAENPGIRLGAILGALQAAGRDKVTFAAEPPVAAFGSWAEQLLAESTGKEGRGLVPVEEEPLGGPEAYGEDRVFVHLSVAGREDSQVQRRLEALERAGHPVVRIQLSDPLDLGGEFFRWEMATAVAGIVLKVNPFDEPNVQESKDNTERLLQEVQRTGRLPETPPALTADGLALTGDVGGARSAAAALGAHLRQARPGDYAALMAYLAPSKETHDALQAVRLAIRDRLRVATTVGYGPRFLHSTGQLHKGGPNTGVFLQITAEDEADLPIPGAPYTFGVLKAAQALGDFEALRAKRRRIVRVGLGPDVGAGLRRLREAVEAGLRA
ncbi:MAG: glucose-6-phosphate isomerase [candidate division NC10 bacterium]|nr:glucose-6-phosphate isomerase [candidate division NC10 bacterium]